jgi:CRP-like cAMP-binding protein/Zn-dependent protease
MSGAASLAESAGIWAACVPRPAGSAGASESAGIWAALDDQLDLGGYVPVPTPGVELRSVEGRGGQHFWVIRTPEPRYLRLDDADRDLWTRMDGIRTVRQIALDHFLERGGFVAERLARLVRRLRQDGFLGRPPADLSQAIDTRLHAESTMGRWAHRAGSLLELDLVRFPKADRWFEGAYRYGGWLLYARPVRVLWIVVVVAGLFAWWRQVLLAEHALFQTNGSYTLGLLTLAALDILGVKIYQVAQALTMKRYGIRITSAGLHLYYGLPMLTVETSDSWMASRKARMAVSLSGPFSVLVLGGALALAAYPLDGTEMGAFLFKAAFVWLVNGVFNLLPILDLDGYFLLVDYLEMPALRHNANQFVREALLPKLRARSRLTREERTYTWYWLFSACLVVLIPVLILEARDLRYASSFAEMWHKPDMSGQLMALGMGVVLLGPAAFAILARIGWAVLGAYRLVVARVRYLRGQVRREHIEALAGLPFLSDLSRAELRQIGAHLKSERYEAGQLIVRQGAHGDRFYLILDGDVAVLRLAADGHTERLATLGAGDYFGETALVANVPRTATVVAETPAQLLSLDAGHFRRWLANRVDVTDTIHRTLAERQHLASLPLFASLGAAELDRLAARVLVTRYSAGDVIVEQGTPGDRFFVIVEGAVEVVRTDEQTGVEVSLAQLSAGDFFGEMALLDDAPRNATVTALTPVETYTLTRDDFQRLLDRPSAQLLLHATSRRRAAELAAHSK